jgi:hypothetical protein
MRLARVGTITLAAVAVLAASKPEWWQKHYASAPALACAIYQETRRFERSQSSAETMQLRRDIAPLLGDTNPIFRDSDGTVVTVRDAAADIIDEFNDPRFRVAASQHPAKLIACCPLPKEHDCARIHVAVYADAEFAELRDILLDEHR